MAGVIVDLDRSVAVSRMRPVDRLLIAALVLACLVFAAGAWVSSPGPQDASLVPVAAADPGMWTPTERLALVTIGDPAGASGTPWQGASFSSGSVLSLTHPGVVLSSMPDRLVNEAGAPDLRGVIFVRGAAGLASVESPATIMWTEDGTTYWLVSATHTIDELIRIADGLR